MAVKYQPQNNVYGLETPVQKFFPVPIIAKRNPTTSDKAQIGTMWINTQGDEFFVLTSIVGNVASWTNNLTVDDLTVTGNLIVDGTTTLEALTVEGSAVFEIDATFNNGIDVTAAGATIVGTTAINSSGAADTTIGTGGTGNVFIGNGTNPTAFTGSITTTGSATLGTGLNVTTGGITVAAGNISATLGSINAGGGANIDGAIDLNDTGAGITNIGVGGTGAVNIGNTTGNTAVTGSLTASTTLTATLGNITATNGDLRAATIGKGVILGSTAKVVDGAGDPNGVVLAPQGSLFLSRTGNSTTTRAYINTNGATTWVSITTAS